MVSSRYLDVYDSSLNWNAIMIANGIEKQNPQYASVALFEILYPTQSHDEFLNWRHHRKFNSWEDDIYWMPDEEFEYHWPLEAKIILQNHLERDN